jgi:hypothetical protein
MSVIGEASNVDDCRVTVGLRDHGRDTHKCIFHFRQILLGIFLGNTELACIARPKVILCIFLLATQNVNCLACIVIDASRVHPVIFHFEGVIDKIVSVTKGDQTGRDGWLFLIFG